MKAPNSNTRSAYLVFEFLNEIGIIEQLSSNRFQRMLPDGLSVAGFSVLNHFVRLQKQVDSPANLARSFQITKGAMTNTLARLETLQLITITADPLDGRAKLVRITPKGAEMREQVIGILEPELQLTLDKIGTEALELALPVLRQLRAFLDDSR
jgi:DNA-binding MarR family transcriptional regulator